MSAVLTPEVIVYNTLQGIINAIRVDIKNSGEKESILYQLLGVDEDGRPVRINRFNYYQQATKIFSTPDKLNVNFGYNLEVAKDCALHIIMPSEQGQGDSLGVNEGFISDNDYTQNYKTVYQVIISSDNSSEVNLVYTVLKCMLQMYIKHLSVQGIQLPVVSGQDIMFQDNLIPPTLYHKAINLSFSYDLTVPAELAQRIAGQIYFQIKAVLNFDEKKDEA